MPTHQSCPIRLVRHSLGYSHGLVEIHIITFNWNMTAGPCQAIGSALKYAALARAPGFDPVTCLSQWRRPPTLSCSSWSGHLWTVQWKLCMWFIIPLKRMFNSWAVEPFPDQVFYCKGTVFLAKSLQLAATSSKCWVLRNLKFFFMLPPKLGTSCQIQMAAFSDALVGLGWESGPSHGHTATKSRGDCGGAKAR